MRTQEPESIPRAAYSPAEFAEACGHHASWTYRLLYAGKLHAISDLGRILIPASELKRVLSLAQPYDPKPKQKPHASPKVGAMPERCSDDTAPIPERYSSDDQSIRERYSDDTRTMGRCYVDDDRIDPDNQEESRDGRP